MTATDSDFKEQLKSHDEVVVNAVPTRVTQAALRAETERERDAINSGIEPASPRKKSRTAQGRTFVTLRRLIFFLY